MSDTYTLSPDGKAITCKICGMTSHNQNDIEQKYCGNCHHFHEQWFVNFYAYLAAYALREHTPWEMARIIHEALEIAEAEKYATEKSHFEFVIADANERDLKEIRACLTPFENSIVELRCK